jgi:dipeptidyl aminopeptidase/acylaminoacyl peptidase
MQRRHAVVQTLVVLAGVLVIGRSGLAEPAKVWQLPPTPCSGASLSVTDGSVFVGLNTPDRDHWQVLQCHPDGGTEVVLSGEGRWSGLSVSPDGTQVLVQLDQGECGRQVQWYDLSSGSPSRVGTYQGESIRRYAWSKDGKRWLGLSSTSCGGTRDELVVHSRGGKKARVKLPGSVLQRPAVEYWLSDDGASIYTLLSDGGFYRDHKFLLRIPVSENKCLRHHTSRIGSVLYALSGTNLYRVDAQHGTVTKTSLATLNRTLHLDVCDPRVLALGPDRVGLIAAGKPITNPQSMHVLSYSTLKLQRLTTLAKDATAACSATGEGLATGQGQTWMLWVDSRKQRIVLESRDAG